MTDDRQRSIGKVITVSAERFVVELHRKIDNFTVVGFDDIHYVARIGSFVVIPILPEYVVGEVVGLWEKEFKTTNPGKETVNDIVNVTSAKYLELLPVGMLPQDIGSAFRFGVTQFPSLFSDALYTTDEDLDRIFEVTNSMDSSGLNGLAGRNGIPTRLSVLGIGSSVIFPGYEIKVRIDEFFGGHVAVLGNTGSGKSCTVATVLQSLFEKKEEFAARGATFVVFDVNGEYRQAFQEFPRKINRLYLQALDNPTKIASSPLDESESSEVFRLPHWFMSVEEWELLLRASERTQRPVLRMALGLASLYSQHSNIQLTKIRNHILASCLLSILESDASSPSKHDRITAVLSGLSTDEINLNVVRSMIKMDYGKMEGIQEFINTLRDFVIENISLPTYDHSEFEFHYLLDAFELALLYEEGHGNRQIRDFCAQMITRFKWINERDEFAFIRVSPNDLKKHEKDQDSFIERFVGLRRDGLVYKKTSQIIVLDMNEAADEVVEVASAVMARLVFDRLRKAEPRNRFPVNLVLEEAHRYVAEKPSRYAIDASQTFERIAKEGRKYGVFILLASQRPSELSKTVLSQCSNFVVHRIQNPDDLMHVRQMTPYISESVLKRLPSLPKQHALIFGNAVNLPTTFRVRDVNPKPKSDDAAIRELWFIPDDKPVGLSIPSAVNQVGDYHDQKKELDNDNEQVPDDDLPF